MTKKILVKMLVTIILASFVVASFMQLGNAQQMAIPKPSVPEFSVQFADHSYDVPPRTTSTINPYNNKTETITYPGYHVKNYTIDITIKNQAFSPTFNNYTLVLYYNVRTKGYFGEEWTDVFHYSNSTSDSLKRQSSSEYTVIALKANYQAGDKVDLQVQAILGYTREGFVARTGFPIPTTYFVYQTSSWSPTQTLEIPLTTTASPTINFITPSFTPIFTPSASPSPSASASQQPTQTPQTSISPEPIPTSLLPVELTVVVIIVVTTIAVIVGFLLGKRTRHNTT